MITSYEIISRLLLATLLGGIIGFERQAHGRPAGFRTQLLVCVACSLLMLISESYYSRGSFDPEFVRFDPTRIAAGAMTGVGFLGAGVILKTGVSIQGLTTAASIWIVSAIGLAIGAGQYTAGISGFVITFFSLWFLRLVEAKIPRQIYKNIAVVTDDSADEAMIAAFFKSKGFKIVRTDYDIEFSKKERKYFLTVTTKNDIFVKDIIKSASELAFVRRLKIKG